MKFAGHTMGLPGKDIFQCMDLLAKAGFDGIEVRVAADGQLNDLAYTPEFGRKVREYAAAKRLEICCLTSYYKDFLSPEKRDAEIAGLKRVVDIAAELGCPLARAYGGPAIPAGADAEAARDRIASGLREVAEYAQGKRVAIAIETHIGSGTYSATETADMLRRVSHPNVGVLFDYSWVFRGGPETVEEVFELLGNRILHCHVKDYVGPDREGDFNLQRIVGEGRLPWPGVFAQLRRIGYRGFLCDEYEKYWKKELPEPEDWFPRSLVAMRRMVSAPTMSTRRSLSTWPVRAAVVGLGPIGTSHVKALLGLGEAVRLECLVDLSDELRRQKSEEFGVRAVAGIADLPEDIDVVTIATPPAVHFRLVRVALARGFNVFCEKPLTLDVAEAEALVDDARQRGLHLGVGFKMRYEPWFAKARELIGEIGDLYQVVTAKFQAFGGKPWVPQTGAMQELSSHDFDLIHYIARVRPVSVPSAHLSYRRGWEKEDGFSLLVKYDNGMVGALSGWYGDSFKWDGRDNTFRFIGSRGYLAIDRFERVVLHTDHTEEFKFDTSPNTFELELKGFLEAVRTGTGEYPDAQAGRDATWIVEEAYRVCPKAKA